VLRPLKGRTLLTDTADKRTNGRVSSFVCFSARVLDGV